MEKIEDFFKIQKDNNLLRTLSPASLRLKGTIWIDSREYVDFSSNDYLGLSSHPKLKVASKKALDQFGTGSSASRLLSGDLEIFHQLEERLAVFKGKPAALVFNSGYQANLGIVSALWGRGDVIFSDRLSHASIIDGISLSGAKLFRFQHNDLDHLKMLLKKERNKFKAAAIITETVFSMDGDKANISEIVILKDKYNCKLMVDEAHATGIFGQNGSGLVEEYNLADRVDLIMGTFSKALGSFGAYLACSEKVKQYLINKCRSFIYSTALPASVIASNLASLDLVATEPFRRKTLLDNADYFYNQLKKQGLELRGASQIIPWIVGDSQRSVKISQELKSRGYWVLPIRPPTVPKNEARLRFSLTSEHKKQILDKLINDVISINRQF
ncbi:MAG: 8-amino-7-oxononanoate synthase [Candidatus Omnitrophica bacterium]|nr:8-amino-7-oxononanoate synthase [Candidatus Omnitrophota bacterium]